MKLTTDFCNHINTMRTELTKKNQKLFTAKQFRKLTGISQYHFRQMLAANYIINNDNAVFNSQGAPYAYELNKVFLTEKDSKQIRYNLSIEDVQVLLDNKTERIAGITHKIKLMLSDVTELQSHQKILQDSI